MILGHHRQIEYLEKVFALGRMSHAYLFWGPEKIGKFALAKTLAKSFFCDESKKPGRIAEVCESCLACLGIEKNSYPSVFILDAENSLLEKDEKRQEISIDDIRELKRRFAFSPVSWRIAILNDAEKMSAEAANSFLKLLEEPGEKSLFFIVTSARENLLPTIVSRAQNIMFCALGDRVLREFLEQKTKGADSAEKILKIASGRPGILLELAANQEKLENEIKFMKSVEGVLEKGMAVDLLELARVVAAEDSLSSRAGEYVMRFLRAKLLHSPISENSKYSKKIKEVDRIVSVLETTNVNPRLAWDAVFLEAGALG